MMTVSASFGETVLRAGVSFVCGVPDSMLKDAIVSLRASFAGEAFQIASNEGSAVGLAIGHYLSTSSVPLVFLQNSGLGNAVNPLMSLAHRLVYGIPMVLLIGWRGEMLPDGSQIADEPQHLPQGRETIGFLRSLGIPFEIMQNESEASAILTTLVRKANTTSGPVALLVRRKAFATVPQTKSSESPGQVVSRELMVRAVAEFTSRHNGAAVPVVATTGMASRELVELRATSMNESGSGVDFLTVGGMGHAISIATSIAMTIGPQRVICLDGDGALLMGTGALLLAAQQTNLIHVLLNNGVHDSVGGQPTGINNANLEGIVRGFGYNKFLEVNTPDELTLGLEDSAAQAGSLFINAKCAPGHRNSLGRPTSSPAATRIDFMASLGNAKW